MVRQAMKLECDCLKQGESFVTTQLVGWTSPAGVSDFTVGRLTIVALGHTCRVVKAYLLGV